MSPPVSTDSKKLQARYKEALARISARSGTPLPSLIASFAILHELTAVASLLGVFFVARTLGVGERLVESAHSDSDSNSTDKPGWIKEKWREWIDEGEKWSERVGRRYGLFGFEKRSRSDTMSDTARVNDSEATDRPRASQAIAGDVANAVVAYGVTKAIVPFRIPLSFYLSPAFSRHFLDPLRIRFMRLLRRR